MPAKKHCIEVTQKDIDCGVKNNGDSCPIARAVRRKLHCSKDCIVVMLNRIKLKRSYFIKTVFLPKEAKQFIAKFDMGKKVKPFNFIMPEGQFGEEE